MFIDMKIYKKISIIKNFLVFLSKEKKTLESEILKCNLRKVSVHILKSDFIILFFINIVLTILNLFKIFLRDKGNYFFFLFLSPLSKKFEEILVSVVLINNLNQKENYQYKNINVKEDYFEYVVIGSGPSGSINSYYLNQQYPGKVLLIEKGKDVSTFKKKHPQDEFISKWKNGGLNSTLFPMQISFASGECLGGGSEINSGLFHKPSEKFLDSWSINQNYIQPSKDEIERHFDDLNKILGNDKILPTSKSYKYFIEGCLKTKIQYEHVPQFYSSLNNSKIIQKNTMRSTFIDLFLKNNGKIQTNFEVIKIEYSKKKKLWNIIGKKSGKIKTFFCKTLFLNGGAIHTNKILINSKLYQKEVSNFKFHPMIKMVVEFDNQVQQGFENVHPIQFTDQNDQFIVGEASSGAQFIKMNFLKNLELFDDVKKNWKNMSVYHCTFSFGKGNLIKLPFFNKYFYSYNIEKSQINVIRDALLQSMKVLFNGGVKRIFLAKSGGIDELNPSNYKTKILKINNPKDLKFSAVHIFGGVKCGENQDCIVNSFGKSLKYEDLYINDSSLINENLLKNPQGTIMFTAKRNIEQFINEKK